jgi:hypothetical protein
MRILIALCTLPLTACTIAQSDQTATPGPTGTCHREPLSQFVGQPASQELGARMLAASRARTIRWVPKGGVVTMDYREDRLTVHLDGANRVESANCG